MASHEVRPPEAAAPRSGDEREGMSHQGGLYEGQRYQYVGACAFPRWSSVWLESSTGITRRDVPRMYLEDAGQNDFSQAWLKPVFRAEGVREEAVENAEKEESPRGLRLNLLLLDNARACCQHKRNRRFIAMARLVVAKTNRFDIPGLARNRRFSILSEKRITKAVRETLRQQLRH